VRSPVRSERGSALIEFLFAGIPLMLLLLIIFEMGLALWSYHTLATALEEGATYASTKGQGCTYTGNSCRVSVSQIVQDILSAGVGIDPNKLGLTFHSSVSAYYSDINCNPASSCLTGTYTSTLWPPGRVTSGTISVYGDMPNLSYVDITGTYPSPTPIIGLFWPFHTLAGIGTLQFSAESRQVVQF
jgi:Flp pilus assembly protein TadG